MSYGIEDCSKLCNTYVALKGLLNANEATRKAQEEKIAQLRKECGKLNDEVFDLRLKCCQELKHDEENLHLREENRKLKVAAENALQDHAQADTDTLRALHERNQLREENERLKSMIQKSSLIEVDATKCTSDGVGHPVIVKDGTMLVHKDHELRELQRAKDLQSHAATARKLAEAETTNRELRLALDQIVEVYISAEHTHQACVKICTIARETLAKHKP